MRRTFTATALAALALTLAGRAAADPTIVPCTAENTQGLWALESIKSANASVQAFYDQSPNEYLRLGADGGFAYFASNRPETDRAAIEARLDEMRRLQPGEAQQVSFPQPGLMVVRRGGKPVEGFRCALASDASRPDGPLMFWGELPGTPALQRVHHRLR